MVFSSTSSGLNSAAAEVQPAAQLSLAGPQPAALQSQWENPTRCFQPCRSGMCCLTMLQPAGGAVRPDNIA